MDVITQLKFVKFQNARRSNVIDKMLCLGMKDKAIKMLLESTAATNPSEPLFYEYNLRACLAATCRSAPNDTFQNGKFENIFSF